MNPLNFNFGGRGPEILSSLVFSPSRLLFTFKVIVLFLEFFQSDLRGYCPLFSFFGLIPRFLKRQRSFHALIKKCFVLLSNRCGISQSTPFGAPHPCWHTTLCPPPWGLSLLVGTLTPFGAPRPCWHTTSCPLPWGLSLLVGTLPDIWSSNPPLAYIVLFDSPLAYIVVFGLLSRTSSLKKF